MWWVFFTVSEGSVPAPIPSPTPTTRRTLSQGWQQRQQPSPEQPSPESSSKPIEQVRIGTNKFVNIRELRELADEYSAGNCANHIDEWEKLTSDQEILQMIKGDIIDFIEEIPVQNHRSYNINMSKEDKKLVRKEIKKLLKKKIIVPTEQEQGDFISPIFHVPKSGGGIRIILNLKELNSYIEFFHFKMDTIKTVLLNVTPGCYMASVDLQHAYHSIKIDENYQGFLKFMFEGKLYKYTCYPNGLGPCPRKFTKIMKVPLSHLREQMCSILGYIDDFLLWALTYTECAKNVQMAVDLFIKLGFFIHPEKSVFNPTTRLIFLGFIIDSILMTVTLTDEKKERLQNLIDNMLSKNDAYLFKIREVARIIGLIVSSLPASLYGALYYRKLENDKNKALVKSYGNYEAKMTLSRHAKDDLRWWSENLNETYAPIQWPPITDEMATDASSLIGWGAVLGKHQTGGAWSDDESDIHINVKEMMAIYFAIRSFVNLIANTHVRVLCDNTTAISVINKMGSTKSLQCNHVAQQIWEFCQKHDIFITCAHIPGKHNIVPDRLSRKSYKDAEWMLNKDVYIKAISKLNFTPSIDCFASRINSQHATYASFQPDPYATYIDAFSFNWRKHDCYIFPPFNLIPRVLQKIRTDHATVMVVVPKWTTQAWWTILTNMMVGYPYMVKPKINNLILPNHPNEVHPLHKKLNLMICVLSGKIFNPRD